MAVNGIEIQIGQTWQTYGGGRVEITGRSTKLIDQHAWIGSNNIGYDSVGCSWLGMNRTSDLFSLVGGPGFVDTPHSLLTEPILEGEALNLAQQRTSPFPTAKFFAESTPTGATNGALTDDNGWFAHIPGGEQPEITKGQRVQVRSRLINKGFPSVATADELDWSQVTAYRLMYGEGFRSSSEDAAELREQIAELDKSRSTVSLYAPGYDLLADVLRRAFEQASAGKGKERHANDKPFDEQPMQDLIRLHGVGFATGQASKKASEALGLPTVDRQVAEMLGSIVYLSGAIIALEKKGGSK